MDGNPHPAGGADATHVDGTPRVQALQEEIARTAGSRRAALYNELADLHMSAGEPRQAMAALGGGIDAYLQEPNLEQAAALCRKLLRLFPGAVRAHGTLGVLLLERGLFADGADELARYVYAARISGTQNRAIARLRAVASVMEEESGLTVIARHLEELGDAQGAHRIRTAPPREVAVLTRWRHEEIGRVLQRPLRDQAPRTREVPVPAMAGDAVPRSECVLPARDAPRRKRTGRPKQPALVSPPSGTPAAVRVGEIYGPGHTDPARFPQEASTLVWIWHAIIVLVGWVVFVERWMEVVDRTSTYFMWVAALQIVLGTAVILELTIFWVNHNQKIASRGKRGNASRWVLPNFRRDSLLRKVSLPDEHRDAPVVTLTVERGKKLYYVGSQAVAEG